MRKSKKPAPAKSSIDLDLPDWSGMADQGASLSAEAALQLMEEYAPVRALLNEGAQPDRHEKCEVEFVL